MRVPHLLLPLLVVAFLFGGFALRAAFTQPTTAVGVSEAAGARLECLVEGVKCKGTAQFFTSLYEGVPGIVAIETYASDHRVVFSYDPAAITPEKIRAVMEAPVPLGDGRSIQVFRCLSQTEL